MTESRPGMVSAENYKDNKTEVFARFYEEYLPKVLRYISYRVGDMYLAEDLTSVVFEKALTRLDSYRSEGAFASWLFSIVRNTVTDHFRVKAKRQTIPIEEVSEVRSQDDPPEEEVIRQEDLQKLHEYLSQLSQREQEVISLKFGAELNNREIAKTLGLSESNVGVILYRTLARLRQRFKDWQDG